MYASPKGQKAAIGDIPKQLLENAGDTNMLQAIASYAKQADVGIEDMFSLELADESDGTRRLMALAPGVEQVLKKGGVLLVDELDRELHPLLAEFIVSKFQSPKTNPGNAQLINLTDFPVRTNDNIRKAYLAGKYGAVPEVDTVEVV